MELKELMDVYLAQVENSDRFWALFSGVALAMLGFVIANGEVLRRRAFRTILALAFIVFALLICSALYTSNKKLWAIAYEMRAIPKTEVVSRTQTFREKIVDREPLQPALVVSLHAIFSLLIILVIFYVPEISDLSPAPKNKE